MTAKRYAEMASNIPTQSGKPPVMHSYWAKNQILLYADNGTVCPPDFKQEMDNEVFYLLHSVNIDDHVDSVGMKKLEVLISDLPHICQFYK